jgi:hypothetical protein
MTDTNQSAVLSPIELTRLSAELLDLRSQLTSGTLSPLVQIQTSARAIDIRNRLAGTATQAANNDAAEQAAPEALATGMQTQKNGSVLVMGASASLAAYVAANLGGTKITETAEGIIFPKAKARLAEIVPTTAHTLASGAVVYEHGAMGGGASIAYQGEASGVARDLEQLKGIMAREWGPEKFRTVFGEDASADDVKAYQDAQQAIADRKAQSAAEAEDRAAAPERERQQAAEQAAADAAETARIVAERDVENRAWFEKTIGAGVSDNPVHQAYLNTLETLPTQADTNAAFLGWAGTRVAEFEAKVGGRVSRHRDEYMAYLQEYSETHLAERVRAQRAQAAGPAIALTGTEFGEFEDTPEGKKALRAAAKAYLEGMRGQMINCPALGAKVEIRQRGIKETLAFSGNPKKLKLLHAIPQIIAGATEAQRSENHKREAKPTVEAYFYLKSTVTLADEHLPVRVVVEKEINGELYYDLLIDPPKEKAMLDSLAWTPDHNSGHTNDTVTASVSQRAPDNYSGRQLDSSLEHGTDAVTLDSVGAHQVLNLFLGDDDDGAESDQAPAVEAAQEPAQAPANDDQVPAAPEIIEYTTKKQKVLRGIIRTDLTLEQAKAIDPYTWKMNGGYFIREKHLGGDTADIQAAPTPVVMSAEQQAEAVATAERQAAERAKQALATQVDKLRQVANKAIGDADDSLNADRKTNTAKRAREAGYTLEKAAANKAAGQTLNRVADAIEVGAAGVLAKLSSRAQLEELQRLMRRAMNDADSKLDGLAMHARRGREFEQNDLKYLAFPRPEAWSNRYKNAADTLARKSAKGNSRLIAALAKMGNGPERFALNAADIALTRKAYAELKAVKEGWDLVDPIEAIGRADRLARMGITDTVGLVAAVQALIPHLVEKAQEDPVKKAERAIVGQKVGIDFFPTPAHVAQLMARLANISKGMRVLEPSAGNGNLADAAKAEGGVVDVLEISDQLRNILTAKGYNVVDHDFDGFTPDQPYPAILMNPPFSNRQDAAHIMRAFGMLASGGTLVAIAGEGVFFGKDQKAVAFREWLDEHSADVEPLEGGTFQDNALLAQTSANARLIVLHK